MGFFGSTKKTVSKSEFKLNIRSRLRSKNLTAIEVDVVSMIFRADLDEPEELQKGIDEKELERGIAWMREHKKIHKLSDSNIDSVEEVLKREL